MRRWVLAMSLLAAACGSQEPGRSSSDLGVAAAPVQTVFDRSSGDAVAHGHRLADMLGCTGCHGRDLAGKDWSEPGFGTLWTSNLSRAVARYDDAGLERAIRAGRRPDGSALWAMPSALFTQIGADDMRALIAFLRSRPASGVDHPLPALGPLAREDIAAGKFRSSPEDVARDGERWPPDAGPAVARGRAIVRATCAECHGLSLAGEPDHAPPRPPLGAVVAGYERGDFQRLLRTGKAMGNRELTLMSEVARGRYARFTEAEMNAVYDYLRALPGQGGSIR